MKAIALALLLCGLGDAAAVPTVRAASPHAAAPAPSTLSLAAALDHANRVGPHRITPDLDCAVRYLANNFSQHLLPWADPSLAADALRLEADCGAPPTPSSPSAPGAPPAPIVAGAYFADAINGDDGAAGTQAAPFRSLARGLQATRTITPAAPAQLVLRAGTFYISAAVELTAADSGLTLSAFPGESPVISGGVSLAGLSWAAVPTPPPPPPPPPITAPVQGSLLCAPPIGCCVDGAGKSNPGVCAALAKTPDAATCSALCVANVSCTGYTWHDANTGDFADWCYARLDGVVDCDGAADHTSAWKPGDGPPTGPLNLWRATLPAGVRDFDQLFFRGRRITRARYPNSNPEIDLSPVGYMNPASWLSPNSFPAPQEMHIENVRPYDPWFPSFQWGSGGTVSNFTTGSFWGTRTPPAGDQYVVPAGVVMPPGVPFAGSWTNIEKGVVHAFQGGHWGNWLFEVGKADGSTLYFSRGGVQEARGGGGQAMYVDNVPELLDSAGEWYLNISARTLTIAFNGSDAAGNETLVAAQIAELVRATGSRASPVTDVVLNGLTFAHTLMDAFLPFTVPSGGDVSFHDGGMVRLAGTERVSVLGCTFAAPGGAGLQISEHNRATVVRGSHFAWTGSSAISSAGLGGSTPSGGPDFPEGTLIEGNLMREIGIYVKQSGGYYQGMSANVTVRGNVMFNAARAAINLNDGFAGGHLIASNLLFNSVRETNDHGAINSWDREPYAWRTWDPNNTSPLPMLETRNFIINNYNGVWGLCHDDGSNGFVDTFNFLPWSGTKNYLGFGKSSFSNYFLYSDYAPQKLAAVGEGNGEGNGWNACSMSYGTQKLPTNLTDVWQGNTCICGKGSSFFSFNGCDAAAPLDGNAPLFSDNTYASDDNTYVMKCGASTWTLAQAQAMGVDVGSTLVPVPSTDAIIAAGRALLQF